MNEQEYKAKRAIPPWRAQLRKLLSLPARFCYGRRFRLRCLRWMGVHLGDCYVGRDCLFDEEVPELITIEDGVVMSSRVILAAHDSWRHMVAPIHVRQRAFIGIGSILLPGVTIGEEAVVAAGAVVTHSVEPRTIVGGVPARLIRRLEPAPAGAEAGSAPH